MTGKVLAGCWIGKSACTHRPVVIEVTELVRQPLHVVRPQSRLVKDDVKVGGSDSALTHTLAHNEVVIPTCKYRGLRHIILGKSFQLEDI